MDSDSGNKRKKRMLDKQLGSAAPNSSCKNANSAQFAADEASLSSGLRDGSDKVVITDPTILSACRAALMDSSLASRAILTRHRASIDPNLTKVLEAVGSYTNSIGSDSIREAVEKEDVATAQALILAGADITFRKRSNEEEWWSYHAAPLFDLATDGACRDLLTHHSAVLDTLKSTPEALVHAAAAHCASLAASATDFTSEPALPLRAYHFDPFFLWAPSCARAAVVAWARDALIVELAGPIAPFSELPLDCAGDVLEYFEMEMPRAESQHLVAHCLSPEAYAWVRAVVMAAVMANAEDEFMHAASEGDVDAVQNCLKCGVYVDMRNSDDSTALMLAASGYDDGDVIKLLLQAGADINAKKSFGHTALMLAAMKGHDKIVDVLIKAGADKDVTDMSNSTALMHCSFDFLAPCAKLLLEAGADTEVHSNEGFGHSAFTIAATYAHIKIVRLLLKAGANMETPNEEGDAPLHCALSRGDRPTVKLLLKKGANKEAKDKHGRTAREYAYGCNYYGRKRNLFDLFEE